MERLTKRINDVVTYIGTENEYDTGMIAAETASSVAAVREILLRLAAYEDSRLSPQACAQAAEIEKQLASYDFSAKKMLEFIRADKDGRVVVLPCKVYETDGVRVYEHTVREVIYETAGGPAFDKNAIGKSIFLTRAEAERAIQEMEGKKNGNETSM